MECSSFLVDKLCTSLLAVVELCVVLSDLQNSIIKAVMNSMQQYELSYILNLYNGTDLLYLLSDHTHRDTHSHTLIIAARPWHVGMGLFPYSIHIKKEHSYIFKLTDTFGKSTRIADKML